MQAGARVLCRYGRDFQLGIVETVPTVNTAIVLLDSKTKQSLDIERLSNIKTWITRAGLLTATKMAKLENRHLDSDFDWLALFKSNKVPAVYDTCLYECMWFLTNDLIFDRKLELPEFNYSPGSKNLGLYSYKKGKKNRDLISVSKKLISYRDIFETIVHEMVHQFNFNIDWQERGVFNPADGTHGITFKRFIPIIESRIGVKVTVLHNSLLTDVAIDDDYLKESKKVAPIIAVVGKLAQFNTCFTAKFSTEQKARLAASRLKGLYKSSIEVSILVVTDKLLQSQIKSGEITKRMPGIIKIEDGLSIFPVSEKIYDALIAVGKPIDG